MLVPVKHYSSAAELRADIARRKALFASLGYAWQDPPRQSKPAPAPPPPAPPPEPAPLRFIPKRLPPPASLAGVGAPSVRSPRMTMSLVIREVGHFYAVAPAELLSPQRRQRIVFARQVAVYLIRTLMGHSFPEIGRRFNQDHTTCLHSATKIAKLAMAHWEFAIDLWEITKAIDAALPGPPAVCASYSSGTGEALYGERKGPAAASRPAATARLAHLWGTP